MSTVIEHHATVFEWNQPSLRFAITDLRRNWPRWLFWTLLFIGFEAVLLTAVPSDPSKHHADPKWFFPGIFVGGFILQFIIALFLWPVRIAERQIILGTPGSRGCRRYHFKKIACVRFNLGTIAPSILMIMKSGKKIEIFFDSKRVLVSELKHYLGSAGVHVGDGLV